MNNTEFENYFSPFSRKRFNCVVLFVQKKESIRRLSVSTETTPEKQQTLQEDQRRAVFLCEYKYDMKFNIKVRWNFH